MKLPKLAIKNAQFTVTIVALLVLVGIVSYFSMPRSEDPQFDIPITLIEVIYPGASPTDIETLVVDPLEEELANIDNIKKIESQIKNGSSRIKITFHHGSNTELAYNNVQLAVSTVKPSLPDGVQNLLILKATPTAVAIVQLALWTEPTSYKKMEFYAKLLEKRLETIESVKRSDIWGYPQQVVAVDLNLNLLSHHNISTTQVIQVLQGRAINITPGFVNANTRRFNVKASGNFEKLEQLENTIIVSNEDSLIRLNDIADISFANKEPRYLAYFDKKPVIFVTVEQRSDTNIFALTESIQQEIESFKQTIPKDIKIEVLFEQADSVETRVNGFFDNLWQGLILVGVLALLFLGLRESMVVILVIPLSFLIAIGWLDFAGFGLQQMSIVGLIIALGLLVDDAIVVTESIHREKNKSINMAEAAVNGTKKVAWASVSGTVTTMLAFLPMLIIASDTGDFIRSMPVTVVLVLLASLLLSLTVLPLFASKVFSLKPQKIKTLQHYINHFSETIYSSWLVNLFNFRWLVIGIAVVSLIAMLSLFSQVGLSLFPKAEKPMLLINVEAPPNSSLHYTNNVMQEMTLIVEKQPLVEKVALNVGNSNPRIYYNETPKRGVEKYGQVLVVLKEYEPEKVTSLVKALRSEFSQWQQANITVKEFTQGPITDQPIAIRLISESLSDLERVANDLTNKMKNTEGTINIDNPIGVANTELKIEIDYEKAGLSHIDINTLDKTLESILSGIYIGRLNDINGENYPILVRNKNADIDTLSNAYITSLTGEQIPLAQVVNFRLQKGQSNYFHHKKLRMAKVSADASSGYSVKVLTEEFVQYLEKYDLPMDMYYTLGGVEESRQESFADLTQIMLITAIGIFAILVFQFRSFLQPIIIFSSIPFAMAGSVIGLYLMGLSFSMMAFIGLISLFGIVVNNAIILIDCTNRNISEGLSKKQSVLAASSTRFTPILLTTLTTIGGLIPLTLYGGSLWQPLGIVLISGLCVSAISSFLLVPVLTELLTRSRINPLTAQEIRK
jgi:multidrug efflux pump subunit AcrB